MANKHSTLTGLFTNIADAIRDKSGITGSIVADDFPEAIAAIDTQEDLEPELTTQDNLIEQITTTLSRKMPENLRNELDTQDNLIAQIALALEGKCGVGGGAEVLSGIVTPTDDYNITISDAIGKDNIVLMVSPSSEFNVGAIRNDYICNFTYQNGNMNFVIAGGGYLASYEQDDSFDLFIFDKTTGIVSLNQTITIYEKFCQDTYQYFTW